MRAKVALTTFVFLIGSLLAAGNATAASTAAPRLGHYAGVQCGDNVCSAAHIAASRDAARAFCHGGAPHADVPGSIVVDGVHHHFVCFTLAKSMHLSHVFVSHHKILSGIVVVPSHSGGEPDRFPQTCQAGWCVQGEWMSTRHVVGKIRNPTNVYHHYRVDWSSSL